MRATSVCSAVVAAGLVVFGSVLGTASASPRPSPAVTPAATSHPHFSARAWISHRHERQGHRRRSGSSSRVPLSSSPQIVRIDAATHTAYVSSDQGVVSVVDTRSCTARTHSCPAPAAQLHTPNPGADLAVDDATHTLYVSNENGDGTVSEVTLFDVTHCHAGDVSGCAGPVASIPETDIPLGIAADFARGTLYVGNVASHVDVLDVRTCHVGRLTGCASAVVGGLSGAGPINPVLDPDRATLYVPEAGDGTTTSQVVGVHDLRHCRAGDVSGCGAPDVHMATGVSPTTAELVARTHTLYVQNQDGTMTVLDVTRCSGQDGSGCAQPLVDVPVGASFGSGIAGIDGTLYQANDDSDTVSVVATRHCRAGDTSDCPVVPAPTLRTGLQPFWVAADPSTGTVYTTDHLDGTLEALDAGGCSARSDALCRRLGPSDTTDERILADDATHTWYGEAPDGSLVLFDTRTCTARHPERCAASEVRTGVHDNVDAPVLDQELHTLYLQNDDTGTGDHVLDVVDQSRCTISVQTGCHTVASVPLPSGSSGVMAVDPTTGTLYLSSFDGRLWVIDAAHCNAADQSACVTPTVSVPVASGAFGLLDDPSTTTVYVGSFGADNTGTEVDLVSTVHCRSGDVSGCRATPASFDGGSAPANLVLDRHSLYVIDNADGDSPGAIRVYDETQCTATTPAGCVARATFAVGRAPYRSVIDPVSHRAFVVDFAHAAVNTFSTDTCNAHRFDGCRDHEIEVDDHPVRAAVDPATGSVFVLSFEHGRTYDIVEP